MAYIIIRDTNLYFVILAYLLLDIPHLDCTDQMILIGSVIRRPSLMQPAVSLLRKTVSLVHYVNHIFCTERMMYYSLHVNVQMQLASKMLASQRRYIYYTCI